MQLIVSNLNQRSNLSWSILNKILYSKRLLIDHVECLELCLGDLESRAEESTVFTWCKTLAFALGTILCKRYVPKERIVPRTTLVGALGGVTIFLVVKNLFRIRDILIEKSLDDFIRSLEAFSNCVKRNIVYFNEIQIMTATNKINDNMDYRQTEKVLDCIRAIKEVIQLIYNATKKLEIDYELPMDVADLYCPMEDLQDCSYFINDVTCFTSKNIKDFYNIFAYVQSQYLFRLALLAIQNFSMSFFRQELDFLTKKIQKSIENDEIYFRKLSTALKKRKPIEISSLNRSVPYHQQNTSIGTELILRDSSLKLSSCIYAVAEECQKLDNVLQKLVENSINIEMNDGNDLMKIANSMKSIENSLSICCDDFHRLILVYNKFLTDKMKIEFNENPIEQEKFEENDNQLMENHIDCVEEIKTDDFFAFVDDENNLQKDKSEACNDTSQIYNVDEKLTKKKFKPVLKQLRDRIDPIRQEMLEKERKILELKGIDMSKFSINDFDKSDASDSDGSFDEYENKIKKKNPKDAYQEMRQFLAQKEAINVFKFQLPTENTLSEDILDL